MDIPKKLLFLSFRSKSDQQWTEGMDLREIWIQGRNDEWGWSTAIHQHNGDMTVMLHVGLICIFFFIPPYISYSKMAAILVSFCLHANQPLLPRLRENILLISGLKTRQQGVIWRKTKEHYSGGHFGIRRIQTCIFSSNWFSVHCFKLLVWNSKLKILRKTTNFFKFTRHVLTEPLSSSVGWFTKQVE